MSSEYRNLKSSSDNQASLSPHVPTMSPQERTEFLLKMVKMAINPGAPSGIRKVHFEPSTSVGQSCTVHYEGQVANGKIYAVSITNMASSDQVIIGMDMTDVVHILLTTRDANEGGYENKLDLYFHMNGQSAEDIREALYASAIYGIDWPIDISKAIFGICD